VGRERKGRGGEPFERHRRLEKGENLGRKNQEEKHSRIRGERGNVLGGEKDSTVRDRPEGTRFVDAEVRRLFCPSKKTSKLPRKTFTGGEGVREKTLFAPWANRKKGKSKGEVKRKTT